MDMDVPAHVKVDVADARVLVGVLVPGHAAEGVKAIISSSH